MSDTTQPQTINLNVTLMPVPTYPLSMPIRCVVRVSYDGFIAVMEGIRMAFELPDDHSITLEVAYVDARGNPATVAEPVAWNASDTSIAAVTVDAGNSYQATVTPGGTLGNTTISATASPDIGNGANQIVATFDIQVTGGGAVSGTITPVGDPVPIPPETRSHRTKK